MNGDLGIGGIVSVQQEVLVSYSLSFGQEGISQSFLSMGESVFTDRSIIVALDAKFGGCSETERDSFTRLNLLDGGSIFVGFTVSACGPVKIDQGLSIDSRTYVDRMSSAGQFLLGSSLLPRSFGQFGSSVSVRTDAAVRCGAEYQPGATASFRADSPFLVRRLLEVHKWSRFSHYWVNSMSIWRVSLFVRHIYRRDNVWIFRCYF